MNETKQGFRFLTQRYPAFGFPRYRRFWLASLASVGSIQLVSIGYGWLMFELTDSPLDLGLLGAVSSISYITMAILGGAIADRFDKRLILVATSTVTALLLAVIGFLDALDWIRYWQILLIAGLGSCVSGIDWPTRHSFFPHLIAPSAMLSAVALNSILWQATAMSIPALGGVILAWFGTPVVFLLGAVGFLTMAAVVWRIDVHIEGSRHNSVHHQIAEGVQFILRNRVVLLLITLSYCAMLLGASYVQLMPAFVKLLGVGEIGFGLLLAAKGLGAIIGAVVVGALNPGRYYGVLLLSAASLSGVLVLGFVGAVMIPSYILALLAAAAASIFSSIFIVLTASALQIMTPAHLLGRVMGIEGIAYSMIPLGGLLIGVGTIHVGLPVAAMTSVSVFLLIVLAIAVGAATIRRLDETALSKIAPSVGTASR